MYNYKKSFFFHSKESLEAFFYESSRFQATSKASDHQLSPLANLRGTVIRTCCGTEDPSWELCRDRFLALNRFLPED